VGLAAGVLAVSTASVLIKLCTAPALAIAGWRLTLAALALVLWAAASRRWPWSGVPARERPRAVAAGLLLGLHFATWISSLDYTSVASSVVLVTTNPLFVGLGAWLFLREKSGPGLWLGMALSMGGGALVALADRHQGGGSDPLRGDALALAGALCGSGYLLLGRRVQAQAGTLGYVTLVYSVAALLLLGLALAAGTPVAGYSPRDWLLLALLAALPQGVGHTLINWSLRFFPAGVVAVAILGEPLGAILLAWLVLGEGVAPLQALGALLILGGVALAARSAPGAPAGGELPP
jgi:drug/metabolite transporter (DMT)-like permease